MRKLLVVVVIGLVFAQEAQAVTLSPAQQPFQHWADGAWAPTPSDSVSLAVTENPCYGITRWCVVRSEGGDGIELAPDAPRYGFYWTLGVVYGDALTDAARAKIDGRPGWGRFANVYMACALSAHPDAVQFPTGGGMGRQEIRRDCRALRR